MSQIGRHISLIPRSCSLKAALLCRCAARVDLRHVRLLPYRPGEPLRSGTLYCVYSRWRAGRIHRRRPAILFSHIGFLLRCRGGSPALRRTDWLSLARQDRRCQANWDLRLRRYGAHHHTSGLLSGKRDLRVHASGRPRRTAVCQVTGRSVGRGFVESAAGETRRGNHIRLGGRTGPAGAQSRRQRRRDCLRRHSHEQHPGIPIRIIVGGAQRMLRRQPYAPRWGGVLCPGTARPSAEHGADIPLGRGQ